MKSLEITAPPQLYYTDGDALDLSKLAVTLIFSNNTRKTVEYEDFTANDLTVSSKNGTILSVKDNDMEITIQMPARVLPV